MMEKKFWKPAVTSQFRLCPVPFHLDPYRGCIYGCLYCFARDFTLFSRRQSEHKEVSYLVGNRADLFGNWAKRTLAKEYDYSKAEEVAFKERIPLKIGATSDPFPWIEKKERVTYSFLKTLDEHDYPLEIQTKNPSVLASYADDFDEPNWNIAVTLISTDEGFLEMCEPYAPSAIQRLEAIKRLTDSGKKVMVKVQPAIYPKILNDLPDLVKRIAESGCWAFNTEGLKMRVIMQKEEQKLFWVIGEYLGYDIKDYYKKSGQRTGSDWELRDDIKICYTTLANRLAEDYGLKYYVADGATALEGMGCGAECCGTEVLRDYQIWGNNTRSKQFGVPEHSSSELGKCLVNFMRGDKDAEKTMDEVMSQITKREEDKTRDMPLDWW